MRKRKKKSLEQDRTEAKKAGNTKKWKTRKQSKIITDVTSNPQHRNEQNLNKNQQQQKKNWKQQKLKLTYTHCHSALLLYFRSHNTSTKEVDHVLPM